MYVSFNRYDATAQLDASRRVVKRQRDVMPIELLNPRNSNGAAIELKKPVCASTELTVKCPIGRMPEKDTKSGLKDK